MTEKTPATEVRYERYGGYVYALNKTTQNKEKITEKRDAYLFFLATKGYGDIRDERIQAWIKKGFIRERQKPTIVDFEKKLKGCSAYTSSPLLATIQVTSSCNYHCQHCGNNSGARRENELTKDEIFKLISEFKKIGVLKLTITGGEALLRPDIFEIIKFASQRIPRVTLTSNGSLVTKTTALKLKRCGLAATKISIDGLEKFHDNNRGAPGAYKKALKAIDNLNLAGIEVRVQATLMKANKKELIDIIPVLSSRKVRELSIVPVSPIGRADRRIMLGKEEYRKYIFAVSKAAKKISSGMIIEIRPVFGLEIGNGLDILSTKYKCEALKTTLEITSCGDVIPCSFFPRVIGNIREQMVENIWSSERANEVREYFDEKNLTGKCAGCEHKVGCGGGCLANAYSMFKNPYLGDPYCWRKEENV